ncbi:MAG TPA: hypothetical protein DCF68_02690 [Cyanothece sp. UBA12306]|nr:hypothetical protein [Cyanothece sp. UBA12306]
MTMTSDTNTKTPLEIREIQEMAIAISAKNFNPTMLSEEFLKFSGIIDQDWELGKKPVLGTNISQVTFQNGVSIVVQPRNITFMQAIGTKETSELKIPSVAQKYVSKLPNAEYQGVSLSPKRLIPFPNTQDGAREYITKNLLAPGSWQEFGQSSVQAGLNLLYQLDRCQLSLNINEAKISMPDKSSISALLFSGNFNYSLTNVVQAERLEQLSQAINNWESDLKDFQEIVNQRFLAARQTQQTPEAQSVFPS